MDHTDFDYEYAQETRYRPSFQQHQQLLCPLPHEQDQISNSYMSLEDIIKVMDHPPFSYEDAPVHQSLIQNQPSFAHYQPSFPSRQEQDQSSNSSMSLEDIMTS